ncbi:MAG: AAA family ATPase, partial [Nitrospirae bacterium]|nr:AAA family ATPase [Nitrospirota bacterium]
MIKTIPDSRGNDSSVSAVREKIMKQLAELEQHSVQEDGLFHRNVQALSRVLGLSCVEKELLMFSALLQGSELLRVCASAFGSISTQESCNLLASVLKVSSRKVRQALAKDGALASSGLIRRIGDMFHAGNVFLSGNLGEALSPIDGLHDALLNEHTDLLRMFTRQFRPSANGDLTLQDFPHLQRDIGLLRRLITETIQKEEKGVNVLVYGPPGTGKTEFVKAMVADFGGCLFEVSDEDERGGSASKSERLRAYQLCQRMVSRVCGNLILFDEIEDVFPESEWGWWARRSKAGADKAWTNRLLETNPVPAFWLSNNIAHIDPAFLRRFTYCLELRIPPQSVRRRVVEKSVAGLPVSGEWASRVSKSEHLSPGLIKQACRVAKLAGVADQVEAETMIQKTLENSLK